MMDTNQIINDLRERLVKAESERDALAGEVTALKIWRELAMQFDGHRMQAMCMLKAVAAGSAAIYEVNEFIAKAPVSGKALLAAHDAEVSANAVLEFVQFCRPLGNKIDANQYWLGLKYREFNDLKEAAKP